MAFSTLQMRTLNSYKTKYNLKISNILLDLFCPTKFSRTHIRKWKRTESGQNMQIISQSVTLNFQIYIHIHMYKEKKGKLRIEKRG